MGLMMFVMFQIVAAFMWFQPAIAPSGTPTTAPATTVVRSEDGSVELTLPPGWKISHDDQHEKYQLYAVSAAKRSSVSVKTYMKEDLVDMTLERADENSVNSFRHWRDIEISEAREVRINGNRGLQRDINGSDGTTHWKYLATVIETPKQFFCIYCLSTQSKFEQSVHDFEEIVNSAKDLFADTPTDAEHKPGK